jgi:hypothetical protein
MTALRFRHRDSPWNVLCTGRWGEPPVLRGSYRDSPWNGSSTAEVLRSRFAASLRRRALPGAASFCPIFENRSERISKKIIGAKRRIF